MSTIEFGGSANDNPDARIAGEQLKGLASAAANIVDQDEQVRVVLSLIRSAAGIGMAESEIFSASFGDATGRRYWKSFLGLAMTEAELMRALGTHLATPARVGDAGTVSIASLPMHKVRRAFDGLPSDIRSGTRKVSPEPIIRALSAKSSPAIPPSLLAYIAEPNPPPDRVLPKEATERWPESRIIDDIRMWCAKTGIGDRERAWREEYKSREVETGWSNIPFREVWSLARATVGRPGRPKKSA